MTGSAPSLSPTPAATSQTGRIKSHFPSLDPSKDWQEVQGEDRLFTRVLAYLRIPSFCKEHPIPTHPCCKDQEKQTGATPQRQADLTPWEGRIEVLLAFV